VISLAQFALLRPWWLIAIPIVIALACLAWRRADGFGRWHEVIDPDLLPVLTHLGRVEIGARDYRPVFMALAASLMAIGLAGPSVRNPGAPVFRNMDAIVILMDLSPSVVEGGGLGDAQAAVARLLDRSGTRPVALIVYTGESFLVSVPTREPQALKSAIAVIDPETMPIGGSRPDPRHPRLRHLYRTRKPTLRHHPRKPQKPSRGHRHRRRNPRKRARPDGT